MHHIRGRIIRAASGYYRRTGEWPTRAAVSFGTYKNLIKELTDDDTLHKTWAVLQTPNGAIGVRPNGMRSHTVKLSNYLGVMVLEMSLESDAEAPHFIARAAAPWRF